MNYNETFNPILEKQFIKGNFIYKKIPIAEKGTVLVFSKESINFENSLLDTREGNISKSDIKWNGYKAAYVIDMSSHNLTITFDLINSNPLYKFNVKINFLCYVKDPKAIVKNKITDVSSYITPKILSYLNKLSQGYELEKWLELRNIVINKVDIESVVEEFVIKDVSIDLQMNKEAKDYYLELEKVKQKHKINMEKKKNIDEFIDNNPNNFILKDMIDGKLSGTDLLNKKDDRDTKLLENMEKFIKMGKENNINQEVIDELFKKQFNLLTNNNSNDTKKIDVEKSVEDGDEIENLLDSYNEEDLLEDD